MPAGVDLEKETVITGRVVDRDGQAVGGSFVRLLDSSDEFTAEVVASATGDFRFFAAPGSWTLRALSPIGNGAHIGGLIYGIVCGLIYGLPRYRYAFAGLAIIIPIVLTGALVLLLTSQA